MRATSTAVSLTAHVGVVVAALWATATAHPRLPQPPVIIELPPSRPVAGPVLPPPSVPVVDGSFSIPTLGLPAFDGVGVDLARHGFHAPPLRGPLIAGTPGAGAPLDASLVEELPVMLAGPVPVYPELLRLAGVQGRVVLEAVVDTAGHVEPGSIVVVAAAHPGLVAPARQAIAAMLFRPARVRGQAVRVRVRIPIDFALRR
jgi:protein TonB